ncbi:hypothetical protein [Brevundimonas sp.]|jgi:hypothetical protein|uniref:hypothetical protein n=1 Tax=Brevundimonas sp. TaxID=1871086 RepID=UPI003F6FBEAE
MASPLADQTRRLQLTQQRLATAVARLDRAVKQGPTSGRDKTPAARCGSALKPRDGGHFRDPA